MGLLAKQAYPTGGKAQVCQEGCTDRLAKCSWEEGTLSHSDCLLENGVCFVALPTPPSTVLPAVGPSLEGAQALPSGTGGVLCVIWYQEPESHWYQKLNGFLFTGPNDAVSSPRLCCEQAGDTLGWSGHHGLREEVDSVCPVVGGICLTPAPLWLSRSGVSLYQIFQFLRIVQTSRVLCVIFLFLNTGNTYENVKESPCGPNRTH